MTGTIKCPICGRPYKWYSHTVLDQSACPSCVAEAERGARTAENTRTPGARRFYVVGATSTTDPWSDYDGEARGL